MIISDLDAKGVQGEPVHVSSAINKLKQENADLSKEIKDTEKYMNDALKAMARMEEAGKTNTKQYQYAKESYNSNAQSLIELNAKIDQNNKSIDEQKAKYKELNNSLKLNEMTMSQLRQKAADLQKKLNDTSLKAYPKGYKTIQKELEGVKGRMFDVEIAGKGLISKFPLCTILSGVQHKLFKDLGRH